jgi:hypothetical protein
LAPARVLFVTSERLAGWPRPGVDADEADGPRFSARWSAWRLVGGNNREIARSAQIFDTFVDCYQAVRDVQYAVGANEGAVRLVNAEGSWAWRLELAGVAAVTSGRRYQRHRECTANLQQFLTAMPTATTPYDAAMAGEAMALPSAASYLVDLTLDRQPDAELAVS